ncbi:MAG: YggT family protein [Candidatus Polarisedimenticolaceae bacterium]|nr:YggT family protein [Candidatus Polarisedimenticolaceae bacterium]
MLRFLLQLVRADFYNPVSQFIVKVTTPVLRPLRSIIPGIGGIDLSSLVLAWILKSMELALVTLVSGMPISPIASPLWAISGLVQMSINIFLFSVLIQVIVSWVSPGTYNPVIGLVQKLTDPLMRPARRLIPPISGLDLSPMAVIIGLTLLEMLLIPPLKMLTGSPF